MFADDDEDDETPITVVRYPCMPSLVAMQLMQNRLHLARLGKKLMKWTAMATGRELRKLSSDISKSHENFRNDVRNCYILLARARYFFPPFEDMVLESVGNNQVIYPYEHLGLQKGGASIIKAKRAWRELLLRMIIMVQQRAAFELVDKANKNATKKQNILGKMIIPRLLLTTKYILDNLEDKEREENFRLKRFKQLKEKYMKKRQLEMQPSKIIPKHDIVTSENLKQVQPKSKDFIVIKKDQKKEKGRQYKPITITCKHEGFKTDVKPSFEYRKMTCLDKESPCYIQEDHMPCSMPTATPNTPSMPCLNKESICHCGICNESHEPCLESTQDDFVTKPSSEYVQITCLKPCTHKSSSEDDNQLGLFEKKYKEIVKVSRVLNEDGTISEKKHVITVRTERRNPKLIADDNRNDDKCVKSSAESFSDVGSTRFHYCFNEVDKSQTKKNGTRTTKSEHTKQSQLLAVPTFRPCVSCKNSFYSMGKDSKANFDSNSCKSRMTKLPGKTSSKINETCCTVHQSSTIDSIVKRKANAVCGGTTYIIPLIDTIDATKTKTCNCQSIPTDSDKFQPGKTACSCGSWLEFSDGSQAYIKEPKPELLVKTSSKINETCSTVHQPSSVDSMVNRKANAVCGGTTSIKLLKDTILDATKSKTCNCQSTSTDSEKKQSEKTACSCGSWLESRDGNQTSMKSPKPVRLGESTQAVEEKRCKNFAGRLPLCHPCNKSVSPVVSNIKMIEIISASPNLKPESTNISYIEISVKRSSCVTVCSCKILSHNDSKTMENKTFTSSQFKPEKVSDSCPSLLFEKYGDKKQISTKKNTCSTLKPTVKSNVSEQDSVAKMKLIKRLCKNYINEFNNIEADRKCKASMESEASMKSTYIQPSPCAMCQGNTESDNEIEINSCPYYGSFSDICNFDEGMTNIGVGSDIAKHDFMIPTTPSQHRQKSSSYVSTHKSEDMCTCNAVEQTEKSTKKSSCFDLYTKTSKTFLNTKDSSKSVGLKCTTSSPKTITLKCNTGSSKSAGLKSKGSSISAGLKSVGIGVSIRFNCLGSKILSPKVSVCWKSTAVCDSKKSDSGRISMSQKQSSSSCKSTGLGSFTKIDRGGNDLSPKQSPRYKPISVPIRAVNWKTRADGSIKSDSTGCCLVKTNQADASTSTKRSARFDVRPLKSFMKPRKIENKKGRRHGHKSDSHLLRQKKKLPVKVCLSLCEHNYTYFI